MCRLCNQLSGETGESSAVTPQTYPAGDAEPQAKIHWQSTFLA